MVNSRPFFKAVKKLKWFLALLIIVGCDSDRKPSFNKEAIQGIWVAGAVKYDTDFYKPYFTILEFKEDRLIYKNTEDESVFENKLSYTVDSVKIDTISFPIREFSVKEDHMRFVNIHAYRLSQTKSIDTIAFRKTLTQNTWKTEGGTYKFDDEGGTKYIPEGHNQYLEHCFKLKTYKNTTFLIKTGNRLSCDRDQQFAEQIVSYNDNEILVFGFVNGKFKEKKYEVSNPIEGSIETSVFQLCNPYINKNYPRDRYYYQGTEYNGGLYHIRKIFKTKYKVPEGNTESGIFQVRFVVNCEGKAGMYETQAFDDDYKLKKFSSEISDQIFSITETLQDWVPGRNSRTNQVIDTYIYLSFKIKDGEIIRIYP